MRTSSRAAGDVVHRGGPDLAAQPCDLVWRKRRFTAGCTGTSDCAGNQQVHAFGARTPEDLARRRAAGTSASGEERRQPRRGLARVHHTVPGVSSRDEGTEEELPRRLVPQQRDDQPAVAVELGRALHDRHHAVGARQLEQALDLDVATSAAPACGTTTGCRARVSSGAATAADTRPGPARVSAFSARARSATSAPIAALSSP